VPTELEELVALADAEEATKTKTDAATTAAATLRAHPDMPIPQAVESAER
jgi:hypothetical protein